MKGKIIFVFLILLGILLVFIVPALPGYVLTFFTSVIIYSIYVSSANLLTGYTGLVSLGQAMFWGSAGYSVAILTTRGVTDNFYLVALISILVVAIIGASFGALAIRTKRLYFMILTFAFGHVVWSLAMYALQPYTDGFNGIRDIPRPNLAIAVNMQNNVNFYFLVVAVATLCFAMLYLIINSPFGQAITGIRDNEHRMIALGYNTFVYKYLSYVLSGIFAGIGGILFAYSNCFMNVSELHWLWSGDALMMMFIGGIGTFWGPALGALVYTGLRYWISVYTTYWFAIEGVIFVVVVLFFHGGIGGFLTRLEGILERRSAGGR